MCHVPGTNASKPIQVQAKVAQSVEHSTENAGVAGSIPALGTSYVPQSAKVSSRATLVDCVFVLLPSM